MKSSKPAIYFLMAACLMTIMSETGVNGEPKVPCFFIFGDSVVDNGNNNHRNTTAKVNYFPYGIDFELGPTGRFNNGRNLADFIAEFLGFDTFMPPYADATTRDLLRGVNYASGGAGIFDETIREMLGDVIGFNEQLSNHEATVRRVAALLGGRAAAKRRLSRCVYFVCIGNNDYIVDYLPKFHSKTAAYDPQQFAALLLFRYSIQLQRLYDNGARKIAVLPVGKLGCLPQLVTTYGASDQSLCDETSNDVVGIFNNFLELLIQDLNNQLPGAKFVISGDISGTSSYGNITVLSSPCCQVSTDGSSAGQCIPGIAPCRDREKYMFWDGFHPSEAGTLLSAKIAYQDMSPLFEAGERAM